MILNSFCRTCTKKEERRNEISFAYNRHQQTLEEIEETAKKKEKKSFEEDIYIRIFVEKFLRIANCKSEGKELMEDRFGRSSQKVSGIRT